MFKLLNNENTFVIDENTGKIVLQSQLDRESVDEYEIIVQAHDLGSPGLTSTCLVHVKVVDENDNAPEFTVGKINLQLSEDTNIGDSAYEFKALDQDLGKDTTKSTITKLTLRNQGYIPSSDMYFCG